MPTILLFVVQDKTARLVVIATFTFIFAVVIAVLTRAKRHEIFASTAAYVAVRYRRYSADGCQIHRSAGGICRKHTLSSYSGP
jgi:hypothetical protein